jgi:hypothetical protein
MHLLVFHSPYENAWSKLQKKRLNGISIVQAKKGLMAFLLYKCNTLRMIVLPQWAEFTHKQKRMAELSDKIRKRYEHAILIRIQWLTFALLNISLPIIEGYKTSHDIYKYHQW